MEAESVLLVSDSTMAPAGHGGAAVMWHTARALHDANLLHGIASTERVEPFEDVPRHYLGGDEIGLAPSPWSADYRLAELLSNGNSEIPGAVYMIGAGYCVSSRWAILNGQQVISHLLAHNIEESASEFGRFAFDFPYRHLTEPRLLELYTEHMRASSLLTAPSAIPAAYGVRRFGLDWDRIKIIPYGVDLPAQAASPPLLEPGQELRILHVSQAGLDKGQIYLMQAVQRLKTFGITAKLKIAGAATTSLPSMTGGVQPEIDCLGYVSPEELDELYRWAHVFVLPSVTEAFGLPALEAMAYSRPVIVTSTAGVVDLVTHGRNGFVSHPRDVEQLVEHLRYLWDHADRLKSLGEGARAIAEAHPWSRFETKTAAAVKAALE